MKKILFALLMIFVAQGIYAQPKARRMEREKTQASRRNGGLSERAKISFPTMSTMSEDVVWRRDVYRSLDLTKEENSGLYYPIEPVGTQMNLFTYIFKLMMTGQVPAYEYRMDGNEVFNDSARIVPFDFLNNYHIYYERKNGSVRIDNSDIPSREVKSYYIKESAYFDQATSTYHVKVVALCPIMTREDDFGDVGTPYPLFWVKYDDLAPYLSKQMIMTSDLNNAATMSVDDYFTMNMYKGKIYKTNNMLGRTLAQYCQSDSLLNKEQQKIEKELESFEKNIWGDVARKDSLDSIAKQEQLVDKKGRKVKKSKSRSVRESKSRSVKAKREKTKSSGGSSARVTVRRQRH